jgi:vitamin B12 transporter
MNRFYLAAFVASTAVFAVSLHSYAQTQPPASQLPGSQPETAPLQVTVTANRIPTSIQRTGSAITVLRAEEIQRSNPASLVDILRNVPGLDTTETGGPGGTTSIRLRGANTGQTLVLLDGVRMNDPGQASGEFEASMIAPALIDRIEVLRGPQSALYGSDAIGGVINIITKKGRGAPIYSLRTEAGSYGTMSTIGSMAGSTGPWSYAFSGSALRSEGFSRYGYRIGRLERTRGPFEADAITRFGGFGRIGYDPGNGFRFDIGVTATETRLEYDGTSRDLPNISKRRFTQISAKAELDTFDNSLTHTLQLFANRSERIFYDSSFKTTGPINLRETRVRSDFIGDRVGAEYQGLLRLKQFGSLIFGARIERETADSFTEAVLPTVGPRLRSLAAQQDTQSLFALWQLPIGERLTVSLGGRYDKVSDVNAFLTWRTTAAYNIAETGTKFRASAGTGAKAPTLFQRFSPQYGTPDLTPEKSFGYDAGVDQSLWNGRVTLSLTAFSNRFKNLINFETSTRCLSTQVFGCYVNVARAATSGLEGSARVTLIEDWLSTSGTYTYLHAKDLSNNKTLARRAPHVGKLALQITPLKGWLIEPSVVMVSGRFSSANEVSRLAPYARLDLYTEYTINQTFKVHGRIENITDAKYQEVINYGTTGRAYYAGVTATW